MSMSCLKKTYILNKQKITHSSAIAFMQRGQTLIEILIAMAIGIVVISVMTVAVTTAVNNANVSKNQNLSTQYAQEGMEIVRQLQMSNYQLFSSFSGRYCLANSCTVISAAIGGACGKNAAGTTTNCTSNINNNLYIRQVDVLQPGSIGETCDNTTTQVTSSVLWTDGKCPAGSYCHSERIVSCFSNVNVILAP